MCDAYEAMTEQRAYRESLDPALALDELRRCAGTQFDPRLVELFAKFALPSLGPEPALDA